MPGWLQNALAFIATPALAALLSGYAVSRWKGREEYVEKRLDELCGIVSDVGDLAAEYWAMSASEPAVRLHEAKILAGLRKIAGLRVALASSLSVSAAGELAQAESIFLREATGGSFGVHNRSSDLVRVGSSQHAASDYVVAVRRARLNDLMGFWKRQ